MLFRSALKLLRARKIWLRNAVMMNDFSEIEHGRRCLVAAWHGEAGGQFRAALARCDTALPDSVAGMFDQLMPMICNDTFLYCVSEHDAHEDERGRLSMWRAYGGANGVAIVFNGAPMHAETDVLGAFSSPVLYADAAEFATQLAQIASRIAGNVEYLRALGTGKIRDLIFSVLRYAVVSTKHPGFADEREWRVVASPSLYPSGRLESVVEVVRGVPQRVLKISLENDAMRGLTGFDLPTLLDRIIIGPCDFPEISADAFRRELSDAGIPDATRRVVISDIPLRHDR